MSQEEVCCWPNKRFFNHFVCTEYLWPWLHILCTNNNSFFSCPGGSPSHCWVFKSGGVGLAKSLMCDNFIEAAHYFEQMAAFDLSGDWAGAFPGKSLFFKCSMFFMHNNSISLAFKSFGFRKAFFFCFSGPRTQMVKQLCATYELGFYSSMKS